MDYFFRYNKDGSTSINIFVIRVALFMVIMLAYRYRKNEKLLKTSLKLGVIIQALMIYWYMGNYDLFIHEGLPLFHCRISAIMMTIGYYKGWPKISRYFAWLGVVGALIAFAFPDPSPYIWPHITNVTYVGSHLLLATSGVIILSQKREFLNLKDSLFVTIIMNIVLTITNMIMKSNYGYLSHLPKIIGINLPKGFLFILLTTLISVAIAFLENRQVKLSQNKLLNKSSDF